MAGASIHRCGHRPKVPPSTDSSTRETMREASVRASAQRPAGPYGLYGCDEGPRLVGRTFEDGRDRDSRRFRQGLELCRNQSTSLHDVGTTLADHLRPERAKPFDEEGSLR